MTFHSFDMRGIGARRLRFALLASLVFHLLLLWPALPRLPDRETPMLQATLRSPPPVPAATAPSLPPAVAPMRSAGDTASGPAGGIAIAPRQPVLARKPFDPPQPAPVPEAAAIPSAPVAVAAPVLPAATPSPAAAPATPAAGSPTGALLTQANASGEPLDGLRGYRLSVASEARRFKRYPAQAMAAGWAGTAEVRLEVGGDGRPRAATVSRSSGHEPLDRAALTMIDAGALRARLPDSLRGKTFAVVLPVVFNLDDE
jgi:protein TonB